MDTTTLNSMCRCCAAEGMFKDIKTSYHWMGEEEVYGDMLRECFDVKLVSVEDGGICEVCITQLRNASNFKKQVLHTEKKFKRILDSRQFKPTEVKEEVSGDENSSSEDNENDRDVDNDNIDDEDYVPDFEMPIKTESPEESKSRKRGAKATTSRAKKSRVADDEDKSGTRARKKRKLAIKRENDDNKPLSKLLFIEKHMPEMKKQWHNLTTILKCSNATPFKDRNDAGYVCAYCFESYPDPCVLRTHTHRDHCDEKRTYKAGSAVNNFVAYLDVVDLKCTLCDRPMDDLKTLVDHIVTVHEKKYYLGETDYFQPFKMTNEQQMYCCLCGEPFHNMKLLMQHMNVHYRNFICTTCGAGFVNSFRLMRHETTHVKKKSSYPCRQCGEVFAAESKKKAHVNTEHKGIAGDSVCRICKARFKNYYQKTRHMVQVHNAEGVKCDVCDKRFNLKSNLISHMRNVHLKERPYECSVCNMGFFIKRQMLYHYMATHTNERNFKCEVCGKAYATQCSKRKHMKKNHGILPKSAMMVPNMQK